MITGNKGEWSEIYALFKLLGDKQLFLGDKDIERLEGLIYPIIKVLRSEINGNFKYSILDEIVVVSGDEQVLKVPIEEFKKRALFLLKKIKENKERTFSVPEIEEFMQSINCLSLKASSSAKTDITIVVHDQRTNQQPTLGFSIKSQLGSPSTLLNAGKTTNFIFKIEGKLQEEEITKINSIVVKRGEKFSADLQGRVRAIHENNCTLNFLRTERKIFSNNLILIDSRLPEILSQIVFGFYSSEHSNTSDLVNLI
jgi:type II restriction enzyme